MRSAIRSLALGAALALTCVSLAMAMGPEASQTQSRAAASDQRVLVLLRMPAQHFRPGSDYGGSYGDGQGRSARWGAASRLARAHGVSLVDEWPMPLLGVDCYVMRVRPDEMIETALKRIAGDPEIVWSQPMQVFRTEGSAPIAR